MINKKTILFALTIILAIFLRFSFLEKFPIGFYSDEAAFGYNAYSLLKTGRDEFGVLLPIALKSFGDYKAVLYSYYLIPFVKLFGLSEASVRMGSAFLGVGELLLIYFLVKLLFHKSKYALLSMYFAAISPFALQFNRMVHENNLAAFLVTLAVIFFLLARKSSNFIFLSVISSALSIYTYHDTKILIPLIFLVLFLLYRHFLYKNKVRVMAGIILFGVMVLPLLINSREMLWARPKNTIIFSDLGTILDVSNERGEDKYINYFSPVIYHNKIFAFGRKFLNNYLSHFSWDFLFFSGDYIKNYSTVNSGILYIAELLFLPFGLYYMFYHRLPDRWLVIAWLLVSPVASSLTKFVPSASRTLSLLVPLSIIPALGMVHLSTNINGRLARYAFIFAVTLFFTFNISYYLHFYYFNTPIRYAKEWHYGMKDVIEQVKKLQDQYQEIWFTDKAWGYIYPLFYLPYPPEKYQPQAKLGPLNEFGFGWIDNFDKYRFQAIPGNFDFSKKILYVVSPGDIKFDAQPLARITYPNGQEAFTILDTDIIKSHCPLCSKEYERIHP